MHARLRAVRTRREPPRFRTVAVQQRGLIGPRLARVTLGGPELDGLVIDEPAASVRILLPTAGNDLVMPAWNGNEFLLPDGSRPPIRTFTPLSPDPDANTVAIAVVLHGTGAASEWAERAEPGDPVALSGPGRGYTVDASAPAYLLAGDETAIPAITQLLEALPPNIRVAVHIEVAAPDGRSALPAHPNATVAWHDLPPGAPPGSALFAAIEATDIATGARVWAAGEAAAVQRIRRHLFEARGFPRSQATVRGYWKVGRGGGDDD